MPQLGSGISWVWYVIRNRFSVHGVVPLAFPGRLKLTVWPLKRGGYCLVANYFYNVQGRVAPGLRYTERTVEKTLEEKECYALPISWSHRKQKPVTREAVKARLLFYLNRYKLPPLRASHSPQGWQHGLFPCLNFCSRSEFQKLEVEESAGRHVGLCSTTFTWTEHCWAILCSLTLPTEMK